MDHPVVVYRTPALLGESPLWSPAEGVLYWIDLRKPALHRFDPVAGADVAFPLPAEIGSIGLRKGGGLIAGLKTGFAWIDGTNGKTEMFHDPEADKADTRLNEGKVDRAGRFWCGSIQDPGFGPHGVLYRLDPDLSCTPMEAGIGVPNGIAWSPDDRFMYFADSVKRQIYRYRFDRSEGRISDKTLFAQVPDGQGLPDGAAVDAEGYLWSAHMDGWKVSRYAPDGTVVREIGFPVQRVTSLAFGGPDLDTLYVTTARTRLTEEQLAAQPLSGSLFAVNPGVRGLPEPEFAG